MKQQERHESDLVLRANDKSQYLPNLPKAERIEDDELEKYRTLLQKCFLSGKLTSDVEATEVIPASLAPYSRGKGSELSMPFVFDLRTSSVASLSEVLQQVYDLAFEEGEGELLSEKLPELSRRIGDQQSHNLTSAIKGALEDMLKLFPHADENAVFVESCRRFRDAFNGGDSILIRPTAKGVFQLLNLQLENQEKVHSDFLSRLTKTITGLRDLLILQGEEDTEDAGHYDFAGDLLSVNTIDKLAAQRASTPLSETRIKRLKECLKTLEKTRRSYCGYSSVLFAADDLAEEYDIASQVYAAKLQVAEKPLLTARDYVDREMRDFIAFSAAFKLAELELEQRFDEALHGPYFEGFDVNYLGEDDLAYFRPVLVVGTAEQIARHASDFVSMTSGIAPVKILAVQRTVGTENDALSGFGEYELSSLAIFRRNAYVFQGGIDSPDLLNRAFYTGLHSPFPAFWYVMLPLAHIAEENLGMETLRVAVESRYFPRIEFNVQSGLRFGSHFHLGINKSPESDFTDRNLQVREESGVVDFTYKLTMADVLSISDPRHALEIIPTGFEIEELMPIADYLMKDPHLLAGKIPYFAVVDRNNELRKAVVPIEWLNICRARLEYWQFLQELSGASSSSVNRALDQLREEQKAERNAEIDNLHAKLVAEFELSRQEDLRKAIMRILNALMDPEQMKKAPDELIEAFSGLTQTASTGTGTGTGTDTGTGATTSADRVVQEIQSEEQLIPNEEEAGQQVSAMASTEAWVESDMCTSCSDCIDALPSVFKYNEDKQAYVHDPTGGTYGKIVAAAEKCPARCIHPGMPHNPDEPGLEKLIQRAEKFN